MSAPDRKAPPPSRGAIHWFLFLSFFHLLPVPWYLAVVAGLAPASFLFAAGVASLLSGGNDSLTFAGLLLLSALVSGFVFYFSTWLVAIVIGRLRRPLVRSLTLTLLLAACLFVAMNPVFVSGGHGSSSAYSLFDFINVLSAYKIPESISIAYFSGLASLLLGLLGYQHLVALHEAIPLQKWQQRRRLRRRVLAVISVLSLLAFGWNNRVMLVVKPLADFGFASAQYHLAMAIKADHGHSYQDLLVKAAEQGHLKAAMELVLHPRSQEEKLRWLPIAAAGGMAGAEYKLYLELMKAKSGIASPESAQIWLERAARKDDSEAQFELGGHYLKGSPVLGIEKDVNQARQWLERAGEHGHVRALEELIWHYEKGAEGFPYDPQRAVRLLNAAADAELQAGDNQTMRAQKAATLRTRAQQISVFETLLEQGDPQALIQRGNELLHIAGAAPKTLAKGLALLERAANQGNPQLEYELGAIFLFGLHGQEINLPRGREWWAKALAQNHVKTMEYVAPSYQNGRFGYPIDLLKSKALVERIVMAYRDGRYVVDPDPEKEKHWTSEYRHFDRLFQVSGGSYQSPDVLQSQSEAGDAAATYQLGRQLMVAGPDQQRQGLLLIEKAADAGFAEAQYRLVTLFDSQAGIMRNNPARGIALLQAAAEQHHLPAMGAMALGYEKGRYGLPLDLAQAKDWYQRLLQVDETGEYRGEIDERFIPFNRQRLVYTTKALETMAAKASLYASATPLEKQIIDVEERYRINFQNAVNALDRRDGSPAGQKKTREEIERLREEFNQSRDAEISRIKSDPLR